MRIHLKTDYGHGDQVPKAVQAVKKLVDRDKIFAMFMGLGTPHDLAAFKLQERKRIPNFLPLSAAHQMLDDPIEPKFVSFSSYFDGIRAGVKYMKENEGSTTVCPMHIPSDFGKKIAFRAKDEAEQVLRLSSWLHPLDQQWRPRRRTYPSASL